jgi:hypothetical protein
LALIFTGRPEIQTDILGKLFSQYIYIYTQKNTHTHTLIYIKEPLWSSGQSSWLQEMYCDSCEVRTEFIYVMWKKVDRLCGLVVRVSGYRTEMYCISCKVQTEFIYDM